MAKLGNRSGCFFLVAVMFVPGLIVAYWSRNAVWILVNPIVVVLLMLVVAAIPSKRKITPQQWATELEKHLLGTEGPYDWDDATSVTLADERLAALCQTLIPDFDLLNTPEKQDEFRRIVEALKRGEVPNRY